MSNAKNDFNNNISTICNSISIYQYLKSNAKYLDSTIMLRSQFVLLVSALDTYIHSAVINKIIELYFSQNSTININVDVPLALIHDMKKSEEGMQKEILFNFLITKFSKDSFQSPKSVEYAYSVIGVTHLWRKVSAKLDKNGEDIKNTLALIIKRRNKIAHESDWNKATGKYEDIDLQMVSDCKDFIQQFVGALDDLL